MGDDDSKGGKNDNDDKDDNYDDCGNDDKDDDGDGDDDNEDDAYFKGLHWLPITADWNLRSFYLRISVSTIKALRLVWPTQVSQLLTDTSLFHAILTSELVSP